MAEYVSRDCSGQDPKRLTEVVVPEVCAQLLMRILDKSAEEAQEMLLKTFITTEEQRQANKRLSKLGKESNRRNNDRLEQMLRR